jgi:hypothetical protein
MFQSSIAHLPITVLRMTMAMIYSHPQNRPSLVTLLILWAFAVLVFHLSYLWERYSELEWISDDIILFFMFYCPIAVGLQLDVLEWVFWLRVQSPATHGHELFPVHEALLFGDGWREGGRV